MQVCGVEERNIETQSNLLEDQQGSVSSILNADGSTLVNESYTAYGDRRDPTTWNGSASSDDLSVSAGVTRQGYTWQTALGNMGLNHMNGRVQDAITGVFLSPDPYITEPGNPQNYNRYSYVYNNPMSHTDPSGFSAVCLSNLCDGFYFAGGTGSGLWGSNNGYSIDGGADVSVCYSYSCQKTQTGKSDYYWMQFDAYADKNTNQIVKVTSRLITYHYLPNSILQSSNRSILEQAVGTATTSSSSGSVEARNTSLVAQSQQDDCTLAASIDSYLDSKGSPMVGQGQTLDTAGQRYDVDPRLLVSIAGAETSFGKNITAGQYNVLNWLWNGGPLNSPFASWQTAITSVAKGLSRNYDLTNVSTAYSKYCTTGTTCGAGLRNLSTFMLEQRANPSALRYPAANSPRHSCQTKKP